VVVDTLGIGGARAATALAWDETAWAGELARREYDLVIVAYGTNDSAVGSRAALEAFPRHLAALLGRIRKGAPGADCVLFGPIDRAAKKKDPSAKAGRKGAAAQFETAPEVQVLDASERAEAERLGCAFFSGLEAMGGAGSMIEWVRASPPLGHRDHVHLTREGYLVVGERLAKFLMDGY
jgi:lysophospholipase L1-like esterase